MNDYTYYCRNGLPLGGVHPDQVRECLGVATFWGIDIGPHGDDALARVLAAAEAWKVRQEAWEREHSRKRERVLAEARILADINRAREKAEEYLRSAAIADTHSSDVEPER